MLIVPFAFALSWIPEVALETDSANETNVR